MRLGYYSVLLFASLAVAHAEENVVVKQVKLASKATTTAQSAHAASKSAGDEPVIVIAGLCDAAAKDTKADKSGSCRTVVTRAQFEALANAIEPHMDASAKAQLAAAYPRLLRMQQEFRRMALENDANAQQVLAFAKLRAEAEEAEKALKSKAEIVTESDIQKYYDENSKNFEQAELLRIYLPFSASGRHTGTLRPGSVKIDASNGPVDDPMKPIADSMRTRAAAGESFDSLQAEAFSAAGVLEPPPATNIGTHMASEMSLDHRQLISMAVGEVSPVLAGPNGYYIYKVVAKGARPLEQVRAEITSALAAQNIVTLQQKIEASIKPQFKTAYFGVDPATAAAATQSGPGSGMPGAQLGRSLAGKGNRIRSVPQPALPGMIGSIPNLPTRMPAATPGPGPSN